MVVGSCSIGGWCYSGWWVLDLRTLAQFQGSGMFPGSFQDFLDGYIKPEGSFHYVMTIGSQSRRSQIVSYG